MLLGLTTAGILSISAAISLGVTATGVGIGFAIHNNKKNNGKAAKVNETKSANTESPKES